VESNSSFVPTHALQASRQTGVSGILSDAESAHAGVGGRGRLADDDAIVVRVDCVVSVGPVRGQGWSDGSFGLGFAASDPDAEAHGCFGGDLYAGSALGGVRHDVSRCVSCEIVWLDEVELEMCRTLIHMGS
jgi:hypothetical protein